ncbi:hypothetical protein C9939_03125 [Pseudidiomarina aestuarii]|nr:hypothetical protein C9939_03125 [Pseudidiomarina aestuarii]
MVDGSVVILENIFRHMENRAEENVSMARLASEAAREVARPIVFASSIIIIVFLPLFTLQGVEGKMFSPMAYTIAFALLGAMIVALVLVPALMTYAFKKDGNYGEPRLVGWLKDRYQPVLDKVMAWPKVVAGAAVLVLVLGVSVFPLLGSEFVPTLREGTLMVRSTLPPAASLDSAIGYAKRIQTVFEEFEPVTGTYSRVGRAEVGGDPEPVNVIATTITLKPLGQWSGDYDYEGLQSAMSDAVADRLPGLANNFSQPIQLRTDELLSGIKAQIAISIFGENFGELARIGEQVKRIAQATPGAVDVRMQQQGGKPQIRIRPDREAMARYGLSVDQLFATVETGIGGDAAGQVFEGIKRFDLFVRLREEQRDTVSAIEDLLIRTPAGAVIPLTRVADVERFIGPKMISRSKASRRLFVQLNVRGRDMGGVVTEIRRKVAEQVDMPTGYFVEYGGQFENQQRAMKRLYLVVPVTLALIFLLLYTAFNSLRYAALIYLNVPIATMGGIFALWLSGMYLSVSAAVGFIAVFGVAVLVSYINQLRDEGMDVFEAARTGAMRRLRPVLMTALTSMLGLFAFCFSSMADNITATLVCIAILLNLNLPTDKLLRYVVLVVFSVNAGGTALITGDVTTLMIFLADKVEIPHLLLLSLPAFLAVASLSLMLSRGLNGQLVLEKKEVHINGGDKVVAGLFFATILSTIGGNILFGIPPVLMFLFGLSLMFMVVQFLNRDEPTLEYIRKIEFDTLLFFLGVLLLVGMLKELGVLAYFPHLYDVMPPLAANYVMGLVSSLFDNVPLTAALLNSGIEMTLPQWLTLTYAVGVGGSLLVIGSAAGVVAMSKVESLTFGSYLKYSGYLLVAYSVGFAGVLGVSALL